jgi:hypothetical protein
MISKDTAIDIAHKELKKISADTDTDLVLLDDETIERHWGWVFFYNSRAFIETGDYSEALAGNAPFIVNRMTGEVTLTGTAMPIEHYISEYEATLPDGGA